MKIENGQKVKDVITGFVGMVTGRCEYITGCNQVLVQPEVKEPGKGTEFQEPRWFDEDRCEVFDIPKFVLPAKTAPGFDKPAPVK